MKILRKEMDSGTSVLLGLFEVVEGLVVLVLCLAVLLPPLPPTPGFSQGQWRFGTAPLPPVPMAFEVLMVGGVVLALYVMFLGARRIAKTPIKLTGNRRTRWTFNRKSKRRS